MTGVVAVKMDDVVDIAVDVTPSWVVVAEVEAEPTGVKAEV